MKIFAFILLLSAATVATTGCEPAHKGAYEAPGIGNEGELNGGDPAAKIDSSVEKAIMNDSTKKRDYHL